MFDQKEWAGLDLVKYQNQIWWDISICCDINVTMFPYASVLYVKPKLHFVIVVYHLAFNVSETLNGFISSGDGFKGALQITCTSKIKIGI